MKPLWFTKSRRAKDNKDYETWVEGGVTPTLNVFDNTGDTRATVIIFYGNRVNDIRIQDDKINTLQARMGTGGNNMPMVLMEAEDMEKPVVMRQREGKPGGGKGPMLKEDQSFTIATNNDQVIFTTDTAIPIHDQATRSSGKRGDKQDGKGNGLGIGKEGDPMNTLTSGDRHAVFAIQNTVIGRNDQAGPQGKGHSEDGEPMFTIDTTSPHAVAYDEFNDSISDIHHTLRAGTKQSTGVVMPTILAGLSQLTGTTQDAYVGAIHQALDTYNQTLSDTSQALRAAASDVDHSGAVLNRETMAVRRLTPLECERLQGFPEGWTEGQADSARYKQMGNAVAVPVVEWVVKRLVEEHNNG